MDKTDYTQKVNRLLEDEEAYVLLQSEPMKAFMGKISTMLSKLKRLRAITVGDWQQMKPTDAAMAQLDGLPKVDEPNIPLRPIVSL